MKHTLTLTLALGACAIWGTCAADDKPLLQNETDRINYSVGYQIGGDFKRQDVDTNPRALAKGIEDAQRGAEPLMTPAEMRATLVELKKRIVKEEQQRRQQNAEKYRGEGREFLAANAKKEGVVALPSGLQYKVVAEGMGRSPNPTDTVTVHYRGTLLDGTEFDNSQRRGEPATFKLDSVIRGWQEALPLMKEGAKWQLFIPADLAYGERGPLADRTLLFEVELIAVKTVE